MRPISILSNTYKVSWNAVRAHFLSNSTAQKILRFIMPIKSFADIDNMLDAYKRSKNPQPKNHSTLASGYWVSSSPQDSFLEGSYSRSSYNTQSSSVSSYVSRSTRIIGVADMLDEHGYYNSSRQLIK